MEDKIKKLYSQDCIVVIALLSMLWMILSYMMTRIVALVPSHIVKTIIVMGGLSAVIFATASTIAVLAHLKKNRTQIYMQEITAAGDE